MWEYHRINDMLINSIIDPQKGILSAQPFLVKTLKQQIAEIHKHLEFGYEILFEDKLN